MEDHAHPGRGRRLAASDPQQRLKVMLAGCFPASARIIAIPRQADAVFAISWRLRNDPHRPHKRSKTIRLSIAAELLDDYGMASDQARAEADRRMSKAIQDELASFDADHDENPGKESLVVRWIVDGE